MTTLASSRHSAIQLGLSFTEPSVSIVIPAHNAEIHLASQLQALAAQEPPQPAMEIIVVDDCSTDNTIQVCKTWTSALQHLIYIRLDVQHGAAYARNVGAARATNDLLLFCDSDDVVGKHWVRELASTLKKYHAVGGRLDRTRLNSQATQAGRQPPPKCSHPMQQTTDFGLLPYAPAGSFGIHRAVWNALKGFDARYHLGSEDIDLCWRLQLQGYSLGYAPGAVVHYRLRDSPSQVCIQNLRFGMAHAQLYREYADKGMPRTSTGTALVDAVWALRHLHFLWGTPPQKMSFARTVARRLGRFIGSLQHRTWYP